MQEAVASNLSDDRQGSLTADSKVYNRANDVEELIQMDASKPPRIRIM